jgi:uncharacterized protein (UPF0261 family)
MLDPKALSPEALLQITNSLNISMHSLVAVIAGCNQFCHSVQRNAATQCNGMGLPHIW